MAEWPRGTELVVVSNFNVDLERMGGRGHNREIVAAVETAGLEYLAGKFLPRRRVWCKDQITWEIVRQGRVV